MFRGSAAVRAGLVTPARLRGPKYRRVFPDVYVPATDEAPGLALRSRAAFRYAGDRGVLSGYSAAELLGASCAPLDAPAEVIVVSGGLRPRPGLQVRRDRLEADEVRECDNMWVTSELRTAYDLARQPEVIEAVVALDALARKGRFAPGDVRRLAERYPRARGCAGLSRAVELADARAGSPMESRLRLVLVQRGLPVPEVQFPVLDDARRRAVWLDMAYPEHRIGIEYEGADHVRPEMVLRDAGRYTKLVDEGWRIYRFTKFEMYTDPDAIAATIGRALLAPARVR